MVPARLPREVLSDPKRVAEVEVFDSLKSDETFNEKWHVFYSLEWIGEYEGMTRDGEADFIIAHPDVGFLVIEVKGGRVTVRPGPKWTSIDRDGVAHEIENGMRQAMKSKKVVLNALIDVWGKKPPFFRARHGVILPHSTEPDPELGDLARGMPRDLFVFKGQMPRLGLRIRELINWNAPGANDKVGMGGVKGLDLLKRLYGREIELKSLLRDEIDDVERRIVQLSDNQKRVLGLVRNHKSCVIQGAAGTGKTVIAKEKALKDIEAGANVLMLCFNRLLKDHLENELRAQLSEEENGRLAVHTFHGLCRLTSGREKKAGESNSDFFDNILPTSFYEAILDTNIQNAGLPLQFDSLIVDEGQDFSDDWFRILCDLRDLNDATIAVFQDGNQCIYRTNEITALLGVEPITLMENFRNSREIYDVVSSYVDDDEFESMGPPGPSVRLIEADREDVSAIIGREIQILIESEGISPADIVVLTGHSTGTQTESVTNSKVKNYSIWEYKGLDSPVVVLADMQNALSRPELAYVGLSRARSLLIVVDTVDVLSRLMTEIPARIRSEVRSSD
jgi:superfamily I DNA/RNA helicase